MSLKAFRLIPILQRHVILPKLKSKNTCIEACGKNLYVGTEDGILLFFLLEEQRQSNGKLHFITSKRGHQVLSNRKAVEAIVVASALDRLLVLTDNFLFIHQMNNLELLPNGGKLKGITSVHMNRDPPAGDPNSIELCVTLRKSCVRVYILSDDRFTLLKEVSTSESVLCAAISGSFICAALPSMYQIIDYSSGHSQDLFPIDSEDLTPTVTQIMKGEFLLSAPGSLGMFASTAGSSQRPPLQWNSLVHAVAYLHPYIIALCEDFITIHSILDQKQKQAIPFQDGIHVGEYEGHIYISTALDVYQLDPVPFEEQIKSLLASKRIPEALELAENARKTILTKEQFMQMYKRIQQQAGFLEFAEKNFPEATDLFLKGQLDPRELISLYPSLQHLTSGFVRAVPPLHEIPDVNHLLHNQTEGLQTFENFLMHYLESVRLNIEGIACQKEVDGALLHLYAHNQSSKLVAFISNHQELDPTVSVECLTKTNHYYALGMFYHHVSRNDKAVEVWFQLCLGSLKDPSFPGLQFLYDYLIKLGNVDLVWQYAKSLLKHDQAAVRVFIELDDHHQNQLDPDRVLQMLLPYPRAHLSYLDNLVLGKNIQNQKYHTQLVLAYLDDLLCKEVSNTETGSDRENFRILLKKSSLYDVKTVLKKVKGTELYEEQVILHSKVEEHKEALQILVHQLKDFSAAEEYCLAYPSQHTHLLSFLLKLYLDPTYETRAFYIAPAVQLLNNNPRILGGVESFHMLPEQWSIGLVGTFLCGATCASTHRRRMVQVERGLNTKVNVQAKLQRQSYCCQKAITLDDERLCDHCGEAFIDTHFALLPNQTVVHLDCLSKLEDMA